MSSTTTEYQFFAPYVNVIRDYINSMDFFQDWPACYHLIQGSLDNLANQPWKITLPIIVCQAVGGSPDDAVPLSAAWVSMRLAAHILDSIQDGDSCQFREIDAPGQAVSSSACLFFSTYHFISFVYPPNIVGRFNILFSKAGLNATLGQQQGLIQGYEGMSLNQALETYWRVNILKSGSLYQVATACGALAGTDSEQVIQGLSEYGTCLGVILQVIDDCRDILKGSGTVDYEISLPFLLYEMITGADYVNLPQFRSKNDLFQKLYNAGVPGAISTILLEWKQRALSNLELLNPSEAKTALEHVFDFMLESETPGIL